jgi:voltage-gated potassium channel
MHLNARVLVHNSLKFLPIVSLTVIAIHWVACAWLVITPFHDDVLTAYNKSIYWTITTLTTVGYGDITPHDNLSRIFTMIIMMLGVATYGIVIGSVSKLIVNSDKIKKEKKEKFNNLMLLLSHYNIPNKLQNEVYAFYHHVLNKKVTESELQTLSELPQALQNELQIYIKMKLLRSLHLFQNESNNCLKMLSERMGQAFYIPNQNITKMGDIGEEMFVIAHGEVEIKKEGNIIANLKEGQHFGEIALLENTTRQADVIAKTYCDLYVLKREDFDEVVNCFPKLKQIILDNYKKRKSDN